MENETAVIAAAKRGDPDAFERLMAPREKRIYLTCLRILGNEADAADCAQETLLRAFRALPRYRGACALDTWLYRIAVNACTDALRKRRDALSLDALHEAGFDAPDRAPTPYAQLERAERLRLLREGLCALPDDLRAALVLREMQGLPYEQIAQALALPLGTVKSRLARAREKLCAFLRKTPELFSDHSV